LLAKIGVDTIEKAETRKMRRPNYCESDSMLARTGPFPFDERYRCTLVPKEVHCSKKISRKACNYTPVEHVSAGVCWCLLVSAGVCWCLLVSAGVCWCLLVSAGVCWCLLVSAGVCWCLLMSADVCLCTLAEDTFEFKTINHVFDKNFGMKFNMCENESKSSP